MHGIKLKNVLIFGACVLIASLFFSNSRSYDAQDIASNPTVSVSNPVITPSSTLASSPTPTPSSLNIVTPTPTVEQFSQLQQTPIQDTVLTRKYSWKYGLSEWTWELNINKSIYDYYKALPRLPTTNYSVYVTNPLDDKYIHSIADKIRQATQQKGYSEFETVSLAAAFVQSLQYTSDLYTTGYDEYPRYPIETLVDDGGDCEDTAILTASLIDSLGYGVVLLKLPNTSDNTSHMAVGVKGSDNITGAYWEYQGGKYYYLETTGDGWEIGQIPDTYKDNAAQIFSMTPVPILTHSWEVEGKSPYAELKVKVENLGSAAAENVYVYAGFDAGDNKSWNSKSSQPFTLGVNGSVVSTLYLTPPINKHTRLLIQIVYQGYAVEESYSKWFDT